MPGPKPMPNFTRGIQTRGTAMSTLNREEREELRALRAAIPASQYPWNLVGPLLDALEAAEAELAEWKQRAAKAERFEESAFDAAMRRADKAERKLAEAEQALEVTHGAVVDTVDLRNRLAEAEQENERLQRLHLDRTK